MIDADKSGEIDFGEFVLGLYNFCTHDNMSLCRCAFNLYDEDGSGYLDHDEIEVIVKELYGRRAYKKNAQAQKIMKQIEALEWSATDCVGTGWMIDFPRFYEFCRSHPSLLYPAFLMQTNLQTRVLGTGFWTIAAENRRRLENVLGCDNNLIDKLQRMHDQDQAELLRGGGRSPAAPTMDGEFGQESPTIVQDTEILPASDNVVGDTAENEKTETLTVNVDRHRPAPLIGLNEISNDTNFQKQSPKSASMRTADVKHTVLKESVEIGARPHPPEDFTVRNEDHPGRVGSTVPKHPQVPESARRRQIKRHFSRSSTRGKCELLVVQKPRARIQRKLPDEPRISS